VIGAGIQIVPSKQGPIETFGWKNKAMIYELLKERKVSNVVFISGDVHYG
jgi:hypothetical protein